MSPASSFSWRTFLALPAVLWALLFLAGPTAAQLTGKNLTGLGGSSQASCRAGYEWMFNAAGQTPCQVAASLMSSCQGTPYITAVLPTSNFVYPGPVSTTNTTSNLGGNRCLCSMPLYTLFSACAECQDAQFVAFKTATGNCNSSFTGDELGAVIGLPSIAEPAVRNGTVIPPWALHDYSTPAPGTYNPTLAEQFALSNASFPSAFASLSAQFSFTSSNSIRPTPVASGPAGAGAGAAATNSPSPTGGGASSSGASASSGVSPTPESDLSGSGSGSSGGGSSDAGAIAGGVIGGLAIIALTAFAMFWLVLKTRQQNGNVPSPAMPAMMERFRTRSDATTSRDRDRDGTVGGLERQASSTWARFRDGGSRSATPESVASSQGARGARPFVALDMGAAGVPGASPTQSTGRPRTEESPASGGSPSQAGGENFGALKGYGPRPPATAQQTGYAAPMRPAGTGGFGYPRPPMPARQESGGVTVISMDRPWNGGAGGGGAVNPFQDPPPPRGGGGWRG